jgi:diadenosine tetraphosphate (Ap4A) HIT family hydrolase
MSDACPFCERIRTHATAPNGDAIWEFPSSIAYLGRWQFYHGYTVLISRAHATELNQLNDRDRRQLFDDMCIMARAIETVFRPRKLNYEMLGNQVPHLHWHVFPRYAGDSNAHLPVWLSTVPAEQDPELAGRLESGPLDRTSTIQSLRAELAKWANSTG